MTANKKIIRLADKDLKIVKNFENTDWSRIYIVSWQWCNAMFVMRKEILIDGQDEQALSTSCPSEKNQLCLY